MAEGGDKGGGIWGLLTLAGVLLSVGSLFKPLPETQAARARGHHVSSPSGASLHAGHEVKDLSIRGTVWTLVAVFATTALVVGIVFVTIWRFNVHRDASYAKLTPEQTAVIVPPAPHVPELPFDLLVRNQVREQYLLHSYGWTSADHSTARIPIDRAMKLTVGTSLDAAP